MAKRMPWEIEVAMIEAYESGLSQGAAAAKFGYSGSACYKVLRRNGKQARSKWATSRKYSVNEHFFDVIDTEEKSYFLGLLGSDGCVTEGQVKITLLAEDVGILRKFLDSLESEHPIKTRWAKKESGRIAEYAVVAIGSIALVKALEKWGVVERKSLIYTPSMDIPEPLQRHFFRGLVDGDGGIYFSQNARGERQSIALNLNGSQNAVNRFREFIGKHIDSDATVRPHGNIFGITYKGMDLPKKVISLLYGDAAVYLDRKKALADKAIAMTTWRRRYADITKEQLEKLYEKFGMWKIVGEELGMPKYDIYWAKQQVGL